MEKMHLDIYRCIVGPETGFTEEGNDQWFYTLSLAINLMLVWWLNPKIAPLFTILAVIHYLTVLVYGYFNLDCGSVIFSYVYLAIHLLITIIAFFVNLKWSIITALITIFACFLAPNFIGINIFTFIKGIETRENLTLQYNTIILVVFVIIDFLLPIKLWIKLIILGAVLIIHPVIDWLEGYGVIISDVTIAVIELIRESIIFKNKD